MTLDDVPREFLVVLAVVVAIPGVVAVIRQRARQRRMQRRFARGAEGEREAVGLLAEHGYVVEAAQVATSYSLDVDGAPAEVDVRADYLVSRGGQRFVAEVKTGRSAPRLETPSTRRQLLEYQHAFGVGGVLLVDADARSVRLVAFRRPPEAARSFGWGAMAMAMAMLATLALAGFAVWR